MALLNGVTSRRTLNRQMRDLIGLLAGLSVSIGNTYFVLAGKGVDAAGYGNEPSRPFASLAYAIAQCTENNGDMIVLLPTHLEKVSGAGLTMGGTAGITIIGTGTGSARPTLIFEEVGSNWDIDGANTKISNLLMVVTADTTVMVTVSSDDTTIENCEFRHGTGKEYVSAIAVRANRVTIDNCRFTSPVAGANQAIELDAAVDQVTISNCVVLGDWANACIHNPTNTVLTRLLIRDCYLENTQTGDHSIELVSACTGMLVRNVYKNDMTQATGVDPGSCHSFECYHCDTTDVSGILCPAAT